MAKKSCNPENHTNVAVIQEQIKELKANIDDLKTNHIPHLHTKINNVNNEVINLRLKMAYWGGGLATIIIITNMIATILIKKYF